MSLLTGFHRSFGVILYGSDFSGFVCFDWAFSMVWCGVVCMVWCVHMLRLVYPTQGVERPCITRVHSFYSGLNRITVPRNEVGDRKSIRP